MKPRTIELVLLTGILILSAWIVWFLAREWQGGMNPLFEGFQAAGAASAPPTLQRMMMVLIGPGSGINAADGDVFLSQLGTNFITPRWERYSTISLPTVSKIRIDSEGTADWLNFQKIRVFDADGNDIWKSLTGTPNPTEHHDKANHGIQVAIDPAITDPAKMYHSNVASGAWVEVAINPPTAVSRIEIVNRVNCCQDRLRFYTARVYNTGNQEIKTQKLTADAVQTIQFADTRAGQTMATISGTEGRLYATNSASSIFATAPFRKLNDGIWSNPGGGLRQVSRDGLHACGVNTNGTIWCKMRNVEFEGSEKEQGDWNRIGEDAMWVSISNSRLAIVSAANQVVSYAANYTGGSSIPWQNIQSNLGRRLLKQVVLDDTRIGVLDMEGTIYMADLRETGINADGTLVKDPRWFQVGGKRARYLEMRLGRVLIIAEEDGKIYYSGDYRSGTVWEAVPMPTVMNEVFRVGPGGPPYQYTKQDATGRCKSDGNGAVLATAAQLQAAWSNGANWCAWAWTADGGRRFPNNESTTDWCGGYTPGVKIVGAEADTVTGDATCFGKKPAKGAANVSAFNSKFWNAPPLAIEFVPFSTVPPVCGQVGMTGTYQGKRFRYYTRDECTDLGKRLTDGRTTEYNAGNGECTMVNPTTGARESVGTFCAGIQDRPRQTTSQLWDDGSTGNCIFNPDEYKKKYGLTGDTGDMYTHWLTTGLTAGYSPCGNINPSCRWDEDAYYAENPTARGQQPRNALQHYKEIGIKNGLAFCKATGQYPLLEALFKMTELKRVVDLPSTLAAKCKSESIATGAASFKKEEVFLVDVTGGIEAGQAIATCTAQGGAKVATVPQLRDAQLNLANWCAPGWTATSTTSPQTIEKAPYYVQGVAGACVPGSAVGVYTPSVLSTRAAVNCFGVKPGPGGLNSPLRAFNAKAWSQHSTEGQQSAAKRWTCEDRSFAETLFKGPAASDQTYLTRDDMVCFMNNKDTKEVLCRSVQEYKNGEDYTTQLSDNYELSCNKMSQALVDLSGAMGTIQNIKGSLDQGVLSLGSAVGTLDSVYTKSCAGSTNVVPEMKAMCNVLDASRKKVLASSQALNSSDPAQEGVLNAILAPIQQAGTSRAAIVRERVSMKCPGAQLDAVQADDAGVVRRRVEAAVDVYQAKDLKMQSV